MENIFLHSNLTNSDKKKPNSVYHNPKSGIRATSEYDTFIDTPESEVLDFLNRNHYTNIRQLEDGSWCGLFRLYTTYSVCTDITPSTPYAYRWCFKDMDDAIGFLTELTEFDEVPDLTKWTSLKGHRYPQEARVMVYDARGFRKW